MYYYLVATTGLIRADEFAFTYHGPTPLKVGAIVRVPIGQRAANGIVLRTVQQPSFKTRAIERVLHDAPLPLPLLHLGKWLNTYYATHFGLILQTMLPNGLEKVRRSTETTAHPIRHRTKIVLNNAQKEALLHISRSKNTTVLLHGVTGSGKTQIYIEASKEQVKKGRSVLILVPEIALTPQLVAEFANHFSNLLVTHSGLTAATRHRTFIKALESNEPTVVIGPRSALFMPLKDIGLIVIDESHEPSYKQDQSPRYHTPRAASILARAHKATLVLGSATPSVVDYYIASAQQSPVLTLPKPAVAQAQVATVVADFKNRAQFKKHRFFSDALIQATSEALDRNEQVLLFHNRRGTAPTTLCSTCGWTAHCSQCFLPTTLHADRHELLCHLCGATQPIPPGCPMCHEPTVEFKGVGTKLIETEIIKLFPKARIARFDADTKQEDMLHNRYQDLYDGILNIIIGTQIIAKGLDLPKMSVVGVIQADSGLILPDFQAEERVFQLIYQVIGRVGRNQLPGTVIVQTFQPEHPAISHALKRDYRAFYDYTLKKRSAGHFPPFIYLLKLQCSYKTERAAINASQKLAVQLAKHKDLEILGPTPAFHERLGGKFRWQIVVKSQKRHKLLEIVKTLPTNWQFDLDPITLL
ncbi:MAG TPA: primosomal protein N' [Candidatus Saccharimonadales bacterium]|nr:primosomal protein N' [Candidatus Saccharimonadales bacterium]